MAPYHVSVEVCGEGGSAGGRGETGGEGPATAHPRRDEGVLGGLRGAP